MADSKPGSKTWRLALQYSREGLIFQRPEKIIKGWKGNKNNKRRGWFCSMQGSLITDGFGTTKDAAFVDFVEELWCLTGRFPKGYPK